MEAIPEAPRSDIFHAISLGKVRQINSLLSQSDVLQLRARDGKTPLIFAVCDAKDDTRTHLVRMFLRHGSDVNARDESGRTALMYSCMDHDKIDLVRLIARNKKCDPNVQDFDGNTAVMHAIASSNVSALRVLVSSNVTKSAINLKTKNVQGLTPIDLCIKLQLTECCKILVCEGGVNARKVKNQKGLMRLLEEENYYDRVMTPGIVPKNTSVSGFRKCESPIPEDRLFPGSRMIPDVAHRSNDWGTPVALSRSDSLYRSNSNLYNRRLESGIGRSSGLTTPNDIFGIINSQKGMKRALTPISRDSPRHHQITQEDESFGNRTRLPSIPSGKKLYLVSAPNSFAGNIREHR